MKNVEVLLLNDTVKSISNFGANKYKLALLINEELLESRSKMIMSTLIKSKEYEEYESKFRKLIYDHSEKKSDGTLILYSAIGGNGYIITDPNENGFPNINIDLDKYKESEAELSILYKDAIDEYNSEVDKYNELLNEEADEIAFVKFDPELLPELDYKTIKILKPLLKTL